MIIQSMELGLIGSLMVLGTWVSSRVIRRDDFSIEASFCTGGAITALCISKGLGCGWAMLVASAAGIGVGSITSLLQTHAGLNNLLSSILVVTGMISVNLAIASSHLSLAGQRTLFTLLPAVPGVGAKLPLLLGIVLVFFLLVRWFLATELGILLRATGEQESVISRLGKSTAVFIMLAFCLNNFLAAFAGSLFVQYTEFFSLSAGVGIAVVTLAGFMLGLALKARLSLQLLMGSILFQLMMALAFELNIAPEWHKLISAILVITVAYFNKQRI